MKAPLASQPSNVAYASPYSALREEGAAALLSTRAYRLKLVGLVAALLLAAAILVAALAALLAVLKLLPAIRSAQKGLYLVAKLLNTRRGQRIARPLFSAAKRPLTGG